jgi:hypothetical protein
MLNTLHKGGERKKGEQLPVGNIYYETREESCLWIAIFPSGLYCYYTCVTSVKRIIQFLIFFLIFIFSDCILRRPGTGDRGPTSDRWFQIKGKKSIGGNEQIFKNQNKSPGVFSSNEKQKNKREGKLFVPSRYEINGKSNM